MSPENLNPQIALKLQKVSNTMTQVVATILICATTTLLKAEVLTPSLYGATCARVSLP